MLYDNFCILISLLLFAPSLFEFILDVFILDLEIGSKVPLECLLDEFLIDVCECHIVLFITALDCLKFIIPYCLKHSFHSNSIVLGHIHQVPIKIHALLDGHALVFLVAERRLQVHNEEQDVYD